MKINKIYNENCLNILKTFEDNSIDHVVSDFPYGLKFMCSEWDRIPSQEICNELFRVLKSGSFLITTFTPRQDRLVRMILRLEDAGFDVSFSPLYWTYAGGMPKGLNISKAVDKKLGNERKIIEKNNNGKWSNPNSNIYNINTENSKMKKEIKITKSKSDIGKYYEGWYTYSLKPAVEPILVVMKPIKAKSYTQNAIDYYKQETNKNENTKIQTGLVNVDECRIPYESKKDFDYSHRKNALNYKNNGNNGIFITKNDEKLKEQSLKGDINKGRYPANLCVSDNILEDGKNYKSGSGNKNQTKNSTFMTSTSKNGRQNNNSVGGDSRSYSRYFDIDKWFEKHLKKLPETVQKVFPFLIVPKASSSEKNEGIDNNTHKTVKPFKLFTYLITLFTKENNLILDPFMGSGTTILSCIIKNRKYIGIEKEKKSFDIAKDRIAFYKNK